MPVQTPVSIWEILTTIGALGGAVGTIAAVLVALFYPILHSRSHLSVQVVTSGSYKPDTPVHVLLDNTGGKSITALRVMTDSKGKLYEAGDSTLLPKTLAPGESITLSYGFVSKHLDEINTLYVEDSLRRRWICDQQSLRIALAILNEEKGWVKRRT